MNMHQNTLPEWHIIISSLFELFCRYKSLVADALKSLEAEKEERVKKVSSLQGRGLCQIVCWFV